MRELSFSEVGFVSGGEMHESPIKWAMPSATTLESKQAARKVVGFVTEAFIGWGIGKTLDAGYDAIFGDKSGNSGGTGGARSDNRGSTGTAGTSNGDGYVF